MKSPYSFVTLTAIVLLNLTAGFAAEAPAASNPVVPGAFALHQNTPNPFNATTQIRFDLAVTADTRLMIFDAQGRVVATLVDGLMAAGTHVVQYNAGGLASGTYFYRLESAGESALRKLVLIK